MPPPDIPILDNKTQFRFNTSQLVQVIILVSTVVLAWKDLKDGLNNLSATVNGIYTKVEVDKMRAEDARKFEKLQDQVDSQNKQIKRIRKKIGIYEEE